MTSTVRSLLVAASFSTLLSTACSSGVSTDDGAPAPAATVTPSAPSSGTSASPPSDSPSTPPADEPATDPADDVGPTTPPPSDGHDDGQCSGSENAATDPQDCATRAGDGVCTGSETAATTPQDCPARRGDGLCTHSETFTSAPDDCPPPSFTFAGGSVAQLKAASPTLTFKDLTITGTLTLMPADQLVTLRVETFTLAASGSIRVSYSACEWAAAPDLTVIATGRVEVGGYVDLSGKNGVRVTSSATCNECDGGDGGALTLVGDTVVVARSIDTIGGYGYSWVDGQVTVGCDGGRGGDVILSAETAIDIKAVTLAAHGGDGGLGNSNGNPGTNGADGRMEWDAPVVEASELDPNGTLNEAQDLPLSRLTIKGTVNSTDDSATADSGGARYVNFPTFRDRIEDLYHVQFAGNVAASVRITLTARNGNDLDLYFIDSTGNTILAQGNGPSGVETVLVNATPGGHYYLGVSVAPDAPRVGSDYSLVIQ